MAATSARLTRIPDPQIDARIALNGKNELKVGHLFPDKILTIYKNGALVNFSTQAALHDQRAVVFTVNGAWMPQCTSHLEGFVKAIEKIIATDLVDKIICIAPNTVYAAHQWNLYRGDPRIEMWADDQLELTDSMGMMINLSGDQAQGAGIQRSAMYVDKLVIKFLGKEKSPEYIEIHVAKLLGKEITADNSDNSDAKTILNFLNKNDDESIRKKLRLIDQGADQEEGSF